MVFNRSANSVLITVISEGLDQIGWARVRIHKDQRPRCTLFSETVMGSGGEPMTLTKRMKTSADGISRVDGVPFGIHEIPPTRWLETCILYFELIYAQVLRHRSYDKKKKTMREQSL